uniref:Uncharacterized protein n=1 Tax=Anguilla anguilla TaxID=7936 RepID=A0A0E9UDF9_ANGAN
MYWLPKMKKTKTAYCTSISPYTTLAVLPFLQFTELNLPPCPYSFVMVQAEL